MASPLADVAEWIEQGLPGALATADEHGQPELCRVWGARLLADQQTIEFVVLRSAAERTLRNLGKKARGSLNIVAPSTYRSFQFKGWVTPQETVDLDFCLRQLDRIDLALAKVGLPPNGGRITVAQCALVIGDSLPDPSWQPEYVTLRLAVESTYDQAPKPGAGARLS